MLNRMVQRHSANGAQIEKNIDAWASTLSDHNHFFKKRQEVHTVFALHWDNKHCSIRKVGCHFANQCLKPGC